MNSDLDRALCERYPKLFARRHDRSSCMAEGFACEDGWYHILDALCFQLQAETDQHGAPQLVVRQVKQKLGSLRVHVGPDGTPRQRAMIELAKSFALRSCEICGAPSDEADDVLSVRCETHRKLSHTPEQQADIDRLNARWKDRLACLQEPGWGESLLAIGREPPELDGQVIAGSSY
jgi:hypothetical protein